MVNMVNTAVNNNIYAGRKSGSKYNQSKAFQQKEVSVSDLSGSGTSGTGRCTGRGSA